MQGGWQPPTGPGGYGYGPQQAPPPQIGRYEFNAFENAILERTASRARLWGIISTIVGVLECVASIGAIHSTTFLMPLPFGIVAIVVGITFIGTGNSLRAAVTTRGSDLAHLMQAMDKLSTAFIIEVICHLIGFVLVALLLLAFVLVARS